MDARLLKRQADKLHAEADQRRSLASRMTQDASGHHEIGLDDKASVEEQQAAGLEQEAAALETQAEQMQMEARANEAKARDLDAREQALRKDFDRQLKDIDDERRRLLG